MAQITITITESITRTYRVGKAQLDDLDLPTDVDALRAADSEDVAFALIDSDLEDRYEVTDRDLEITDAQ